MTNEDSDIARLVAAVAGVSDDLDHGEAIYKDLKKTVQRIRLALWVSLFGMALDLTLTAGLIFGLNNQIHLSNRIESNQQDITDVSCSLNTLFIQTDTPQRYAAAKDKVLYVKQYHEIYQQRKVLGCEPVINEPVKR